MSRDNPFSTVSGTEVFVRDLAVELARSGNEVRIVCGQTRGAATQHLPIGLTIHEIPLNIPFVRWYSFSRKSGAIIQAMVDSRRVDAVVAFGARTFSSAMFRSMRQGRCGLTPVLCYYAIDSMRSEYLLTIPFIARKGVIQFLKYWVWHTALIRSDQASNQQADIVIASCKETAERLQRDYATDAKKIAVISLGVANDYASAYDLKENRQSQGCVFLHVCSEANAERRGTLFFIRALRIVQCKYGLPSRGMIVGPCYHYKQFADGLDVEFIDRRAANRSMQYYYSICTAVVLPSLSEGFCLPVVEAMMFGRPVIASTAGSFPELIEDGVNGFLVMPGDVSSLAEKMRLVLSCPSLVETMGPNCRAAADKYTISRTAERMLYLLTGPVRS